MRQRVSKLLAWWPVEGALRVACVIGLLTLAVMVIGVIDGSPLWVVAAMSVGQGLGVLAGLLFAVSIAADALSKSSRPP